MLKIKSVRLLIVLLMIMTLLSSCINSNHLTPTSVVNNPQNKVKDTQISQSADSSTKKNQENAQSKQSSPKISTQIQYMKDSYQIQMISEQKNVYRKFYNPDHTHYFTEENLTDHGEMGTSLSYDTYFEENENNPINYAFFIRLEKNFSPRPVLWINNQQAFVYEGDNIRFKFSMINIVKKEKKEIKLPKNRNGYNKYYNSDWKPKIQSIAIILDDDSGTKLYSYHVQTQKWRELYKYLIGGDSMYGHYNVYYGLNGNIFIDTTDNPTQDKYIDVIRQYNQNTGKVSVLKKNAKLLNASPDDRFIAYIDEKTKTTKIYDQKTKKTFEIPYSTELTWEQNSKLFLSVENHRILRINHISNGELKSRKIDLSKRIKIGTNRYVMDTHFLKRHILFDVVNVFEKDKVDKTPFNLNKKVKTYEITFQ